MRPILQDKSATDPAEEINASSEVEADDTDLECPMPDRKKRRLLTRVPSRSIYNMSGDELRKEGKFWGLLVGGQKSVLISRLEANTRGQKVLPFKSC